MGKKPHTSSQGLHFLVHVFFQTTFDFTDNMASYWDELNMMMAKCKEQSKRESYQLFSIDDDELEIIEKGTDSN